MAMSAEPVAKALKDKDVSVACQVMRKGGNEVVLQWLLFECGEVGFGSRIRMQKRRKKIVKRNK